MTFVAIAAPTLLLFSSLPATGNQPTAFAEARKLYFQGADGDRKAFGRADELFSRLYEQQPHDPKVVVYYGSLRLLEASHTWAVWKKFSLSKEGIQLMDEAVVADPKNLEIRFVRAATTYELPGVFHRRAQCSDDFSYLAERAETAVKTGTLEPRLAAASVYYHAEFLADAQKMEQAELEWHRAIAIAPDSRAARDSRAELAKERG